jgi:GTP cyclohydrolase II
MDVSNVMTHTSVRAERGEDMAVPPLAMSEPDAMTLRLRAVHRAIGELKRGVPVLLDGPSPQDKPQRWVLVPAETVGADALREFATLAAGPALLLLAPMRAAAVLRRPVEPGPAAIGIPADAALFDQAALRGLADPTAEQLLPADALAVAAVPDSSTAALALVKLARLLPAALIAPARADTALPNHVLSVPADDVMAYQAAIGTHLVRVAEAAVPLEGAPDARIIAFRAPDMGIEHLAILVGRPETAAFPLARLHSECFTGDLLGSLRCDCGPQLRGAIARMAEEGGGVLLYLAQEGRGIGLVNKLRAYAMQDTGLDTLDANRALGWGADERNFLIAATMLRALGITRIRLLTNNPDKVTAMAACGIDAVREQHAFAPNGVNNKYLATKANRFGHLLG